MLPDGAMRHARDNNGIKKATVCEQIPVTASLGIEGEKQSHEKSFVEETFHSLSSFLVIKFPIEV